MQKIYKRFIVLLVLLLTLSMVGCASSEATKNNEETTLSQVTERTKISVNEAIRIAENNVEKRLNSRLASFDQKVALLTIGSSKYVENVAGFYEIEIKGNYYPVDEYGTYGYQRTFDESFLVGMYDGKVVEW